MDIIYKTCNHCKGNGYIHITTAFFGDGTMTCNKCGGAGYFYPSKTNNETRTMDTKFNQKSDPCLIQK
jgi:excinuclease UvrABC ATPase subunit